MNLSSAELILPPKGTLVFLSDIHKDSESFDYDSWESDKQLILSMEDPQILINGDIGSWIFPNDPRFRGKNGMKFYQSYLNTVKRDFADFISELVPYIKGIGRGNHETSIIRYNGYDIVADLISYLNTFREPDDPIVDLGYTGYIGLNFEVPNVSDIQKVLYYHHGAGGSAPVTGGAIDLQRLSASHRADIYWIGHKHVKTVRGYTTIDYDWRKHAPVKRNIIGFITPGYDGDIKHIVPTDINGENPVYYDSDWATERMYSAQPQGFSYAFYETIRERHGKNRNNSKKKLRFSLVTPTIMEG